MKIGIVVLFINSFGKKGLYNSQEVGLAKALSRRGHIVTVYKCVEKKEKESCEILSEGIEYKCIPVNKIGNNAITDFAFLDKALDMIFCFTDIQLYTNKLYKWAVKNEVVMLPYVGITESTSSNQLVRFIMNANTKRVFRLYDKIGVFAKTKSVMDRLQNHKVQCVQIAPVGLDFDLLYSEYRKEDVCKIKKLLNLTQEHKYVLLVGRIESDRNPLDGVEVFEKLVSESSKFRLLVIGTGSLRENLKRELKKKKLLSRTIFIEKVPNNKMWMYYRIADRLISFSRTEVFGMSILEAMYYECPVYVVRAPGPNDIIIDKKNGYLFDSAERMADSICDYDNMNEKIRSNEHMYIINNFGWDNTASLIEKFYYKKRKVCKDK